MISESTLDAITPVVMRLKENSIGLSVDPASPVAFLNEASKTPLIGTNTVTDEEFYAEFPESLKRDAVTGDSVVQELTFDDGHSYKAFPVAVHETTMLEMAKMIRTRTAALMDHSRNVVQPFVSKVFKAYNEPKEESVTEQWSLVPVELHEGYTSTIVERLLNKAKNPETLSDEYISPYAIRLPSELEYPKTGSKQYDQLVESLLTALEMSPLEVMASLFDGNSVPARHQDAWKYSSLKLAQWLLVEYYAEHPWSESGLSSQQWDAVMSTGYRLSLMGWCAGMLNIFASRFDINDVVLSFDSDKKEVYVLWPVYETYLEQGGAPEVIYGAIYHAESDEGYIGFTIDSLKKNADVCISAWSKHSTVIEQRIIDDWRIDTVRGLQRAILGELGALEDEFLPPEISRKDIATAVASAVGKRVNKITMGDPTELIIEIVGDCIFPHTDCGYVLRGIHSRVKNGVAPKEAATQVELEYITSYVLSGISL